MKGCRESLRNTYLSRRLPLAITWKYKILFHFVVTLHYPLTFHHVSPCNLLFRFTFRITLRYHFTYNYYLLLFFRPFNTPVMDNSIYGSQLPTSLFITFTVAFSSHWYHIYPQEPYIVTFYPSSRSRYIGLSHRHAWVGIDSCAP